MLSLYSGNEPPQSLLLYTLPDKYVLQSDNFPPLIIDRITEDIYLSDKSIQLSAEDQPVIVYVIWGVIKLLSGSYLIVGTERELIGDFFGHAIWRIVKTEILPFAKSTLHLTDSEKLDEKQYLDLLSHSVSVRSYYFSLTHDLTHSMQRLHDTSPDFKALHLCERADERFIWNKFLLSRFYEQENLRRFCVPIVMGFVCVKHGFLKNEKFTYTLISRRSVYRAGTRFNMRGLDAFGNAANTVETEQILSIHGNYFSFVQIRGSIPLKWSQKPNLLYKPTPQLHGSQDEQVEWMRRHLDSQMYMWRYGRIVLINLVDHVGSERELERAFASTANLINSDDVKYEAFDFHKECRKLQWHRLSILIDRLMPDLEMMGYFHLHTATTSKHPEHADLMRRQEGIFRSNCIDCLDRTNVVQSLLAFSALEMQFRRMGLLHSGENLQETLQQYSSQGDDSSNFYWVFKGIWADNADHCSWQYTGTPALKTDFTRTGKRTVKGMLMDGYHSGIRYVYNNFYDGFHQDSIDLILGNFNLDSFLSHGKFHSPFQVERDWKYRYLPLVFYVAFAMLIMCFLIPSETWTEQVMYFLFWGTACIVTTFTIITYGSDFVDMPRLKPADTK